MSEKILEIRHLSKTFGTNLVLKDIDFTVNKGDVTCIIGASGSGKSTLLRCLNLLETPTTGEILYHGNNIADPKVNAAKYRSRVGMVFQSFNLFNNMTVLENCVVGQVKVLKRIRKPPERMLFPIWKRLEWLPILMQSQSSCPADRSRESPLPERWLWSRNFCCLMSPPQLWIRRW